MGKCEDCGTDIEDTYKVCFECSKKRKAQSNGSKDIVDELGKLNNNLYAIRTMCEHFLKEIAGKTLDWNKETKRFDINDAKEN